jgi:hypothetical protein
VKLDFGRALLWIGRKRDQPITYDDLVDAETRAFEAEERLAELGWKVAMAEDGLALAWSQTDPERPARNLIEMCQETSRELRVALDKHCVSYPTEMAPEYLGQVEVRLSREQAEEVLRAAEVDFLHRQTLRAPQPAAYSLGLDRLRAALNSTPKRQKPEYLGQGREAARAAGDKRHEEQGAASRVKAVPSSTPQPGGGDADTTRKEKPAEPVMTKRGAGESGSPFMNFGCMEGNAPCTFEDGSCVKCGELQPGSEGEERLAKLAACAASHKPAPSKGEEVERFVATCSLDIGQVMRANRSGPWVRYSDYEALGQRVGELQERLGIQEMVAGEGSEVIGALRESLSKAETERDEALALIQGAVEEFEKLRVGVGALVATTYCLKRPKHKHEAWDGPCGKCAPCLAKAAYAAALDTEEAEGRVEWRVVYFSAYTMASSQEMAERDARKIRDSGSEASIQTRATYTLPGGAFTTDWTDLEEGS